MDRDSPAAVIKIYHSIRDKDGYAKQIVLTSVNPDYPPIVMDTEDEPRIIGVLSDREH